MTRSGRLRATATVLAAVLVRAIGASRVYLGVHYPTDVAAGIILGGAWAAGVIRWSQVTWSERMRPGGDSISSFPSP
jgi:membrane-associated phospholipid phosphatase